MRWRRRRRREPEMTSHEAVHDAEEKLERAQERNAEAAELTSEMRRHRENVAETFDQIIIEGYR